MIVLEELSELMCPPSATVGRAIERITELGAPLTFQLVMDEAGRLLGTVTDGDIRRGLLRGATLETAIVEVMNREPEVGRFGSEDSEHHAKLTSLELDFLPLVDDAGVARAVMAWQPPQQPVSTALVMAGGQGQRLGAATKNRPKPLVPVGDRPMLEHIMSGLENAGVGTIYVAVHHMGDQIAEFVNDRSSTAHVRLLYEDEPLGTAGSLANIDPPDGSILVVNADVLTSTDFAALVDFHDRHGYDATIGVAQHAVKIPYGVIRHNEDGRFLGIDEKPTVTNFVAAGIYYLAPAVPNLLRPGQQVDMPELLNLASEAGLRIGLFPIHEYWLDVGRPDDLESARQHHVAGDALSRDMA